MILYQSILEHLLTQERIKKDTFRLKAGSRNSCKVSSDTLIIEKSLADSLNLLMQQITDDAITEEERKRIEKEENGGMETINLDGETHVFLYQGKA